MLNKLMITIACVSVRNCDGGLLLKIKEFSLLPYSVSFVRHHFSNYYKNSLLLQTIGVQTQQRYL
jgi:hypothetical protein